MSVKFEREKKMHADIMHHKRNSTFPHESVKELACEKRFIKIR